MDPTTTDSKVTQRQNSVRGKNKMNSASRVTKHNKSQVTHWKARVLCQSLPLICSLGVMVVAIIAGVMGNTMALKVLFHACVVSAIWDVVVIMRFWLAFEHRGLPLLVRHLVDCFLGVYVGAWVIAAWVLKLKSKWGPEDDIISALNLTSAALATAAFFLRSFVFFVACWDLKKDHDEKAKEAEANTEAHSTHSTEEKQA